MAEVFIHQIFYDEATRAQVLPGFIALDNTANQRPDWYEFVVMLNFLRQHPLQEDAWYGFVSPKFQHKTGLSSAAVLRKIQDEGDSADVLLLTVAWDQVAYFLNPWEQGELMHPGIRDLSQRFFDQAGYSVDLSSMVSDSFSSVFSNFVVARAPYWRAWQVLAEKFWTYVEGPSAQGAGALRDVTHYFGKKTDYPMKTFVQERFPALLLSQGNYRVIKTDPSDVRAPHTGLFKRSSADTRRQLQACDLMKTLYRQTADAAYLEMYWKLRQGLAVKLPRLPINPKPVS
jgi:hypothetical protein